MTQQAVFNGQNHNSLRGYNLSGVIIFLHHVFMNRAATKKIISKKYNLNQLSDELGYNGVQAGVILGGSTTVSARSSITSISSQLCKSNLLVMECALEL